MLLTDDNGKVNVGSPLVKGISVTAKVMEHLKGDKVIVFKKKRRKGYKVKNGHRQYLTKLEIEKIGSSTSKKKVVENKTDKEPAAKEPAAKKTEAQKPVYKKAHNKKTGNKKKE